MPFVILHVSDRHRLKKCLIKLFWKMVECQSLLVAARRIKKRVMKPLIIALMQNLSPIAIRLKKCVIKLVVLILLQYNLFLIDIRLNKCVISLLMLVLLYLILFLVYIRLKKSVIKLWEPLMLKYCLDAYKTQEICGKAVDACLPALQFVPDWFLTNKMLVKLDNTASCIFLLTSILTVSHF